MLRLFLLADFKLRRVLEVGLADWFAFPEGGEANVFSRQELIVVFLISDFDFDSETSS